MAGHVFLSYSRDDGEYVRRLARLLTDSDVPVWIDDEIDYGEAWVRVICEKIDTCGAFVPVMSPRSDASSWVAREIARAELAGRQILPILIDGSVFFTLGHLQYEDVTGGRLPTGRFVERLRALSGPSPTGAPLDDRLLTERVIVLGSEVTEQVADRICAQLLLLAADDPDRDIYLYLNSPGGSVRAGMAIYDTMQFVTNDVVTCAMGMAAGVAQLLLCAGTKGKRLALPHARILMMQPSGGIGGTAAEIAIQAEQLLHTRRMFVERVAHHAARTPAEIDADSEPERWFTAQQARDYGLVDRIVSGPPSP